MLPVHSLKPQGFYISASKKSSGKTVISLGLGAALARSGLVVQSYKKGPDYIDPMWHKAATGRPCFNLDFFTQTDAEINATFEQNRAQADVVYVEGNKGLFDGMDTMGSDCNAALAEVLGLPVVLIINASGITRGIAPILVGYEQFANDIRYAGVILNQVAGPRHLSKLTAAIEEYTDLSLLGAVPKLAGLMLEERHMGLIPANEATFAKDFIDRSAILVQDNIDLQSLLAHAGTLAPVDESTQLNTLNASGLKIGIARDRAFNFYYPDDLQAITHLGAQLVFFDTLNDSTLPKLDALFIGGGFPETQLDALNNNKAMRAQIKQFIKSGKPVYAECGGLMYLCNKITYQDQTLEMVGVIDANIEMSDRPIGRGYARLQALANHPWLEDGESGKELACHEFHYSKLQGAASQSALVYETKRGYGVNGQGDGIVVNNMLATYCHQRNTENNPWVKQFIQYIKRIKANENITSSC